MAKRTIASLSPATLEAFTPRTLTVTGTNFVSGDRVRIANVNYTATFVSATQLTVAVPAAIGIDVGTVQMYVVVAPNYLTTDTDASVARAVTVTGFVFDPATTTAATMAANCGVPPGISYKTLSGSVQSNTTYDGYHFVGTVNFNPGIVNVTFINCLIDSGDYFGIDASNSSGNSLIRSTVIGQPTMIYGYAVLIGANGRVERCDVSVHQHAIGPGGGTFGLVKHNYIHDPWIDPGQTKHVGGISIKGGPTFRNLEVIENFVQALDTSGIFIKNDFGEVRDTLVYRNRVERVPGQTYSYAAYSGSSGPGGPTEVTGTKFLNNAFEGGSGGFGGYFSFYPDTQYVVTTGNKNLTGASIDIASSTPYPSAATTGPTAALTNQSGNINTTAAGQTISGKRLTNGFISVRHANCVIQDCEINSQDYQGIDCDNPGATGTTITRCKIQGVAGSLNGILASGGETISFCNIAGFENGIAYSGGNIIIRDSYIHDLGLGGNASAHVDGIQTTTCTDVLIEHNTIVSWDTSCIILKTDGGPISRVVVDNNQFLKQSGVADQYSACVLVRNGGSGVATDVYLTNNTGQPGNSTWDIEAGWENQVTIYGNTIGTGPVVPSGYLSAVEAPDTIVATGVGTPRGALSRTEQNDTLLAIGKIPLVGALARVEQSDTLFAQGSVSVAGWHGGVVLNYADSIRLGSQLVSRVYLGSSRVF